MSRIDKWIFGLMFSYLIIGIVGVFFWRFADIELVEIVWIVVLSLPIWLVPLLVG